MRDPLKILSTILKDKRLSDFQKAVYAATLKIPRGEVRSYRWIAEKSGHPKAYRAVGTAMNKNDYAPLVPCHRVIRSDGRIGQYSKGTVLKGKLLKKEGVDCKAGHCYNPTKREKR